MTRPGRPTRVRAARLVVAGASLALLAGCSAAAPGASGSPDPSATRYPGADLRVSVEKRVTAPTSSDGDLWANCWGADGALYAANGDGKGFGDTFSDIVANRIEGEPPSGLSGQALASGDAVGQVWSGADHTRKPTGMLCLPDGTMYLAVQDLALDFNSAPAATIAKSTDGGRTWSWNTAAPMFSTGAFTTIWFADYGKGSAEAPDARYAYAYGLDGNWRDSFSDAVPDPTSVFLARVPVASVQDLSTWRFFAGRSGGAHGAPVWSADLSAKRPVLTDTRREHDLSVISQGGVTWIPALKRYVYTSWTEYTFEFYEATKPWGPWTRFGTTDFGEYPWTEKSFGGYGTTIPSKFVSADGRQAWLQSNVCPCAPAGMSSYDFGLRRITFQTIG